MRSSRGGTTSFVRLERRAPSARNRQRPPRRDLVPLLLDSCPAYRFKASADTTRAGGGGTAREAWSSHTHPPSELRPLPPMLSPADRSRRRKPLWHDELEAKMRRRAAGRSYVVRASELRVGKLGEGGVRGVCWRAARRQARPAQHGAARAGEQHVGSASTARSCAWCRC
uniref:Uncharacterized protein n=1 Tax=Arundo donax TaxID=35708 RepID=A0A0A8Z7A7_ARUDO